MGPRKSNLDAIKTLREKTGASLNDICKALESAGDDEDRALEFLRQRGAAIAEKRRDRATGQGRVGSYLHHDGRLGALVEVQCETDFVARTPDFAQFCADVAMQVAAMRPRCVKKEDLSSGADGAGDPKAICLLEQPFVKDPKVSVGDLLKLLIAKTGESVVIQRFTRFAVGEAASGTL